MDNCKDLPDLTLNVKDDQDDVFRLLEIIKPDWRKDQVEIKVMSGGFSCTMLRCSHESGESLTVRVRNNLDGLRNPAHERQVIKVLSAKGDFPPVLATFENGFCYEYIPGSPLVTSSATHFNLPEETLRLIAQQMANVHTTVVPEFDYSKSTYFDFYLELLSTSKPWFEGCPSIKEMEEEVRFVQDIVSVAQSPLVLCHGDVNAANLVWNEELKKLTFVDWELVQVAPRGCDIAYCINSLETFASFFNIPVTKPDNLERKFSKSYLQRWNELHNLPSPTTEEIDQLLLEVKYYMLAVNVTMLVYVVKLDNVMPQFGPPENTWKENLDRYLYCKEKVTGIKTFGLHTS